ncbi:hypothetical protein OXX59_002696 [Metschnikowia pulcherrima]
MSLFVLMVTQSMALFSSREYVSESNTSETFSSDGTRSKPHRLTRSVYIPEEEELTPQAAGVGENLELFIEGLKYFVRDVSFDYENFEAISKDLRLRLSNVEAEVASLSFTYSITNQLVYAKQVYDVMSRSATVASFYSHATHEQILLRKLIQLNVGLIYLQDSHGDPDIYMEGYAETVQRLKWVVDHFDRLYEEVTNVSFGVREILQTQLEAARNNLFVLSYPIWF